MDSLWVRVASCILRTLVDVGVRRKVHRNSNSMVAKLQKKIDEERKQLQEGIDMVEEEKSRVREDIEKKELELKKAR